MFSTTLEMKQDIFDVTTATSSKFHYGEVDIARLEQEVLNITGIGNNTTMTMLARMATFDFGMGLQLQILKTINDDPDVVDPEAKRAEMALSILNQIPGLQ
jgi:hypothetical protein